MILGALRYDRLRFGRVTHKGLVMGSIDGVRNNTVNRRHNEQVQVAFRPKPPNTGASTSSSTVRQSPTLRQLNRIEMLKRDIDPHRKRHFVNVAQAMYIFAAVNSPSAQSEAPGLETKLQNFLGHLL
jgi:hypothetical protein